MSSKGWDHIYCYPGTNVLINKLDIRSEEELFNAERKLAMARVHELFNAPVKGSFDLEHLKEIHRHIFQDLYSWAGESREINIAKGSAFFGNAPYLDSYLTSILSKLANDKYLIGMDYNKRIFELAYYLGEINATHPFREGNGRTQRAFIRTLGNVAGVDIKFSEIPNERIIETSISSYYGDSAPQESMLHEISSPLPLDEQRKAIENSVSKNKRLLKYFDGIQGKLQEQLRDKYREVGHKLEANPNSVELKSQFGKFSKVIGDMRANELRQSQKSNPAKLNDHNHKPFKM